MFCTATSFIQLTDEKSASSLMLTSSQYGLLGNGSNVTTFLMLVYFDVTSNIYRKDKLSTTTRSRPTSHPRITPALPRSIKTGHNILNPTLSCGGCYFIGSILCWLVFFYYYLWIFSSRKTKHMAWHRNLAKALAN